MSEKGSVIPPASGGVLPKEVPPGKEEEPSGTEVASVGAGFTTKETEGARPGGAGVMTEGQAQPSASVAARGVGPVVEDELPGAGAPEADDEKGPGDLKKEDKKPELPKGAPDERSASHEDESCCGMIEGFDGSTSFWEIVAQEGISEIPLLDWNGWLRWRSEEGGLQNGTRGQAVQAKENHLWRASMKKYYGENYAELLKQKKD